MNESLFLIPIPIPFLYHWSSFNSNNFLMAKIKKWNNVLVEQELMISMKLYTLCTFRNFVQKSDSKIRRFSFK